MSGLLIFDHTSIQLNDFIHTTNKYFGISDKEYTYTHNIHLFTGRMNEVSKGKIFSKSELADFIQEHLVNHNMSITEVYVSKKPVNVSEIKDSFDKKIFPNLKNKYGWLVFVDPCKIANWSHPCEYWFVINEDDFTFSFAEQWKPSHEIDLELLM